MLRLEGMFHQLHLKALRRSDEEVHQWCIRGVQAVDRRFEKPGSIRSCTLSSSNGHVRPFLEHFSSFTTWNVRSIPGRLKWAYRHMGWHGPGM